MRAKQARILMRQGDLIDATMQQLLNTKIKLDQEDIDSNHLVELMTSLSSKYGPNSENGKFLSTQISELKIYLADNEVPSSDHDSGGGLAGQDVPNGEDGEQRNHNITYGESVENNEDDEKLPDYEEQVEEDAPPA
jgi:hypothetical protein